VDHTSAVFPAKELSGTAPGRTGDIKLQLAEIAPPFLRQGIEDLMVPVAHGKWLSERIPGATAHPEDGEGRLSIAVGAIDRMVRDPATIVYTRS
jgi:hypothetical protein